MRREGPGQRRLERSGKKEGHASVAYLIFFFPSWGEREWEVVGSNKSVSSGRVERRGDALRRNIRREHEKCTYVEESGKKPDQHYQHLACTP